MSLLADLSVSFTVLISVSVFSSCGPLCRPSVHSLSEPTSYDLLCWLNCRLWGCGGNDHVRDNHPFSLMSHRSKSRKNFLKHELLNH